MMQRLIVQLKEPLNTSFCEVLVESFGRCELTPLTENYCMLEGFKMNNSSTCFEGLLQIVKQYANRAFLASLIGELDSQLHQLQQCSENAFLSEFEPPNLLLYRKHIVSEQLWIVISVLLDDFE